MVSECNFERRYHNEDFRKKIQMNTTISSNSFFCILFVQCLHLLFKTKKKKILHRCTTQDKLKMLLVLIVIQTLRHVQDITVSLIRIFLLRCFFFGATTFLRVWVIITTSWCNIFCHITNKKKKVKIDVRKHGKTYKDWCLSLFIIFIFTDKWCGQLICSIVVWRVKRLISVAFVIISYSLAITITVNYYLDDGRMDEVSFS